MHKTSGNRKSKMLVFMLSGLLSLPLLEEKFALERTTMVIYFLLNHTADKKLEMVNSRFCPILT